MGVAYTVDPVRGELDPDRLKLADIAADDSLTLRSNLHAVLLEANWTVDAVLSNGNRYVITNPQKEANPGGVPVLQAKVRIQDTGRTLFGGINVIDIQFIDYDGTKSGFTHSLRYQAGLVYRVHVNPCQLIVWLAGDDSTVATVVMGGIPWVPPLTLSALSGDCSEETPSEVFTGRAWWSIGDTPGAGYFPTYRTGYKPDSFRNWSFRWNGYFKSAEFSFGHPDSSQADGLYGPRLFPVTSPFYYYDDDAGNGKRDLGKMCWFGSDDGGDDHNLPLYLDPLTGWSINAADAYPYVIGQLWESVIISTERSDAQEIEFEGRHFVNLTKPSTATHASWFCSLFLHKPDLFVIPVLNVAY